MELRFGGAVTAVDEDQRHQGLGDSKGIDDPGNGGARRKASFFLIEETVTECGKEFYGNLHVFPSEEHITGRK
jgi:hypothetical protein